MDNFFVKNLLVLACLTLFSKNVLAEKISSFPIVNIGGFINSNFGFETKSKAFDQDKLPDAAISGGAVDKNSGTDNRMNNNPDFAHDAEIQIKVTALNEFKMKYGAIIEVETSLNSSAHNQGINANRAYIFTESKIGKLEFGNNSAVNYKMKVGPETFARAAGGINGKYLEYINLPMLANSTQLSNSGNQLCAGGFGVASDGKTPSSSCDGIKVPSFILIPQSPIAHGGYARSFYNSQSNVDYANNASDANFGFNENKSGTEIRDGQFGDLQDATKINYYTPRISGWQFGATFTPSTSNNGTSAAISQNSRGNIKQSIGYGVNYSNNFNNLGLAISATGETGKFEQNSQLANQRNNLQAYDVGFMASYFGATIGASYGNWGKSLQPKVGNYSCDYDSTKSIAEQNCSANASRKFGDAKYYTAGAAYQFGPFATSLTYLKSNFQENKYSAISLGFDYKMTKGLMPYLEITQYKFLSNQPRASDIVDQKTLSNEERQLKDNSGYVALLGLLFSF